MVHLVRFELTLNVGRNHVDYPIADRCIYILQTNSSNFPSGKLFTNSIFKLNGWLSLFSTNFFTSSILSSGIIPCTLKTISS